MSAFKRLCNAADLQDTIYSIDTMCNAADLQDTIYSKDTMCNAEDLQDTILQTERPKGKVTARIRRPQ